MKARLVLKLLTASVLVASCAHPQAKRDALHIRPIEEVQHGYDRAQAQYELGRYYHGQRRYAQAIAAYRKALAIEPDRRDAEMAIGVAYAEQGDLTRAREQLERAALLHPRSPDVHNNLGFVHHLAGDYPAAARAYKQALSLDGQHAKARENLLRAMEAIGAGERIARTDPVRVAEAVPVQTAPAWVQVAPAIFEMRMPAPVAAAGADATPSGQTDAAQPAGELGRALEIANGNGMRGMASTVAHFLSGHGVGPARLSNQRPFDVRATRIEYRPGSAAEAAALDRLLPMSVPRVVSSTLRPGVRVRIVLGRDLGDRLAHFGTASATRVAHVNAPATSSR